jgi:hypothetical protein
MPAVPNWIPHAIVILPGLLPGLDEAIPVKDWRATKTQVVVTLDNPKRTEMRFYLDGLRPVGSDSRGAKLLDGRDLVTVAHVQRIRADEAVAELEFEIALARFDRIRGDREAQARLISDLRDKATAALAALEPLL